MLPGLHEKLTALPALSGVYQFKDKYGKVIYVGKAKNLRSRVRSYFQKKLDSPKTRALMTRVNDLELIITDSEVEALVLENNLIKQLKPRYNINLKDDKSFPYIRVTNEPFPQIFPTRQIIRDGSRYFGPYTDVKSMKISLRMLNKLFKIRSCKYFIDDEVIEKKKVKVCLDYHIKKCDGPCEGLISKDNYGDMVDQVVQVLRGKTGELISGLEEKMHHASTELKFEEAGELRDKIEQLKIYTARQKVVSEEKIERDIIAVSAEDKDVAATILIIRGGKLVGKKQFRLTTEAADSPANFYSSVIKFFYNEFVEVPKEIILGIEPDDAAALLEWLNTKSEFKVKFTIPKRKSEPQQMLMMAMQNSKLFLKEIQLQRMKREGNVPHVLTALKRDLRLNGLPRTIECIDISNSQGSDSVASLVVFVDGKPKKSMYRKFIIKSVEGPNDFASMQEVIERRYSRLLKEEKELPDLIMVDGGKGQLSSAVEILNRLGLKNYEIIGLAKQLEEVFLPGQSDSIIIPKTSSSLKLLQHVRDEAHRFAITFHRQRRGARTLTTELLEVRGIGEKAAQDLLRQFKSLKKIKEAEEFELASVVGKAKAKIIRKHFHN